MASIVGGSCTNLLTMLDNHASSYPSENTIVVEYRCELFRSLLEPPWA